MEHHYWPQCGHDLLAPAPQTPGHLLLTDDFLRRLLEAPELAPIPESCASERDLHQALLADPRQVIADSRLAILKDPDARDNYRIWLRFRDRLQARPTLEGAYLALFQGQGVDVPPGFVHQLTQIFLRQILGNEASAFQVRAAQMLYRSQKISIQDEGAVMAADEATIESFATTGGFGSLGELLRKGDMPTRSIDLDVLQPGLEEAFWEREQTLAERLAPGVERHDWVLKLNHGSPGLQALCGILERWVLHFLAVRVKVQVEKRIDDPQWVWHVGLDAQASAILNDLFTGQDVAQDRLKRLLCLFSLRFEDPGDMAASVRGHPVYLAMAMDEQQRLRLKPQNLLLNLPLARPS